jgi:hypothetical protein
LLPVGYRHVSGDDGFLTFQNRFHPDFDSSKHLVTLSFCCTYRLSGDEFPRPRR